jgi:hypothetical protein
VLPPRPVGDAHMTQPTHAHRRDELGFLTRRMAQLHPAPLPARWLKIGMVTCWIVSCALAMSLGMLWLP